VTTEEFLPFSPKKKRCYGKNYVYKIILRKERKEFSRKKRKALYKPICVRIFGKKGHKKSPYKFFIRALR